MSYFKQKLKEALDNDRTLAQTLVNVTGFSNPTPIYKFVNHPGREFQSFSTVLGIVETVFPGQEREMMASYIPTLDPNGKNARVALEYTAKELKDMHDGHIERIMKADNDESRLWTQYYALNQKRKKNEIDGLEFITQISELPAHSTDLQILKYLSLTYIFHSKHVQPLVKEYAIKAMQLVNDISDPYIKANYNARLHIALGDAYLKENDVQSARHYLFRIKEMERNGMMHLVNLQLGKSYILSDYDKAEQLFEEALGNVAGEQSAHQQEIKKSLNFLYSHWEIDKHHFLPDKNAGNTASLIYYLISQNKGKEARHYLNELNFADMNDWLRAFCLYYEYRLSGNENFLYQSIEYFKQSGERYYRQISLKPLQDKNPYLLGALQV